MQRWWYSDDGQNGKDKIPKCKKSPSKRLDGLRKWRFQVMCQFQLRANEKIAVTGNCDELGKWDPDQAIFLYQENESNYAVEVDVPCNEIVEYRYFVASTDPSSDTEEVHVRKWETHFTPRTVPRDSVSSEIEMFGIVDGVEKIDRGWLTNETMFEFKFFNNPLSLKERMKNRLLYIKITPMNMRINAESSIFEDSSVSNDTRENSNDQPAYALTEVSTLNDAHFRFVPQEQFGRAYHKDDVLAFHVTVTEPENIAYLVDLYTYRTSSSFDEPPHHLGYNYLLPNLLKKSDGQLELPITCASKHRPLGMMKVEYVKITPINNLRCDMRVSYARYWNHKYRGLDVGHRGAGTSFKVTSGQTTIRENTIASLKKAGESGAHFVEFDVQLSKDLVPVIYHDFHVYVSLKKKATFDVNDMMELPMRELSLEQLKKLKVYHIVEARNREPKFFDEDLSDHQPFPELSQALEVIDDKVGFNIEVKWAQMLENGLLEDNHSSIDRNLYVDRILDVVLGYAGKRKIVFSCFDAEICVMLRNKQNIYPVMFLTVGKTKRYPKYYNPCCNSMDNAVKFASGNELLGVVAHTEDLLQDISQIDLAKELGLILFCWGDDNNCKDTIKFLKEKGLHAIIYDKVDLLIDSKEKLFYIASKESQHTLQQIEMEVKQTNNMNANNASSTIERYLTD